MIPPAGLLEYLRILQSEIDNTSDYMQSYKSLIAKHELFTVFRIQWICGNDDLINELAHGYFDQKGYKEYQIDSDKQI